MPEFGRPGLPVLSDEERLRRNNLQQEWSGRNVGTTSRDISPSPMADPYADEPSADQLLSDARNTLDSGEDLDQLLRLAGRAARNEAPASAEQFAPRPTTTYKDVAEQTLGAGSFIPGPAGVASRLGMGLIGASNIAEEGPTFGNVLQTAVPLAFDAIPAMRGLRAATPGPIRPQPGMHWTARQPAETAYRAAGELPALETSPLPRHLLREIAEEGPANNPSIRGLPGASDEAVDLTGALDDLGEASLSPEQIASARAAERFGRNFRSEGGAPARSVPSMEALAEQTLPPEVVANLRKPTFRGRKVKSQSGEMVPKELEHFAQTGQWPIVKEQPLVDDLSSSFGGATARTGGQGLDAGDYVRLEERSPIGKATRRSRKK